MRLRLNELMWQKQAKENRKISQYVVEEETGISRATLIDWSKGRREQGSFTIMETLMDYFECDLNTLFERIPNTNPS